MISYFYSRECPDAVQIRGLSTDDKPTEKIPNGACFYEMDSKKIFFFDRENETWIEQ